MPDKTKILIIDDDPLIVQLYQEVFQVNGYEVETAFNGEEGFKKLSSMELKPTIILSDIMMPQLNGLDLLKKIKETPGLKNIPVIFLTNLGGEEDAKKGLSLGAITYLVKSQYQPKEIVAKVKELIAAYSRKSSVPDVKVTVKKINPE